MEAINVEGDTVPAMLILLGSVVRPWNAYLLSVIDKTRELEFRRQIDGDLWGTINTKTNHY